jgi:hypothetical protein
VPVPNQENVRLRVNMCGRNINYSSGRIENVTDDEKYFIQINVHVIIKAHRQYIDLTQVFQTASVV